MTGHLQNISLKEGREKTNRSEVIAAGQTKISSHALFATVSCFILLFCNVGLTVWGLPFYYDFWVKEHGWSRAQVTSGNALSRVLVGLAFGFLAGWLVDRFGARRLMMAGTLMTGIALAGLGSISTLGMFYLFYLCSALGYVGGGPMPNQVLLSRWFSKSRGKAMGIAYLGIGFGGAASPWISHALIQQFGWHMALKILGLVVIAIGLPAAYFVKDPPVAQDARAPEEKVQPTAAFKSRHFYLLMLASMLSIGAVSGTQQNLKLFLSLDLHFSQIAATRVLSLVLVSSLFGRLFIGWLADRFPRKFVMLLIYALAAAAIPLLFIASSPGVIFVFAAIFGIALGGEFMIVPLMAAELFGIQSLGRLMGVFLAADGVENRFLPGGLAICGTSMEITLLDLRH